MHFKERRIVRKVNCCFKSLGKINKTWNSNAFCVRFLQRRRLMAVTLPAAAQGFCASEKQSSGYLGSRGSVTEQDSWRKLLVNNGK